MKHFIIFLRKVLVLSASALMITGSVALAGGQPINMKASGWFPETYAPGASIWKTIAQTIETLTDGRATTKIFWSSSLVPLNQEAQAIKQGIIDYGFLFGAFTPGSFELYGFAELPGLMPNQATANRVVLALENNPKFKPHFEKQFEDYVHISTQVHMRSDIHSSVPIPTLADLKGKVILTQNKGVARLMKALGASVSMFAYSEWYTSLERDIVQGAVCAWGSYHGKKLYEVTNNHTLISVSPFVSHFAFNKKTWAKFTPEEQARIRAAAGVFPDTMLEGNVRSSMEVRFDIATPENGHKFFPLSSEDQKKLREAGRPIWDEWAEEMEKQGYPGKEILKEAIKLVDAYKYG